MKNKFTPRKELLLLLLLPLAVLITQAWTSPPKNHTPTKSTAVASLIKICGGNDTFEQQNHNCFGDYLEAEFLDECTGDVPMNIFLTNLHPDPVEDVEYYLPAGVPDLYTQHQSAPGVLMITGPHNGAMLKGKITGTSGEDTPVFGIDIGLHTVQTNEIGCPPGQATNENFPTVIRIMQKVGPNSYELYPLDQHYDQHTGIFSCDVFQETNCICYGGACLNDGLPQYDPDVCMICDCDKREEEKEERLAADEDHNIEGITELAVTPNPFKDNFTLSFELNRTANVNFQFLDAQGKEISHKTMQLEKGEQRHRFNTSSYSPGVYYLQLSAADQRIIKKLIVIK